MYNKTSTPAEGVSPAVTIQKNFTYNLDFTVQPDSDLTGEKVPFRNQLILWLPVRGISSAFRCGIVPFNTTSTNSEGLDWVWIVGPNGSYDTATGAQHYYPFNGFKYAAELALPYDTVGIGNQNAQIQLAPDLATDYTVARCYAALLSARCQTRSGSSLMMNGILSAAAVSDTRDVAQQKNGAAYNPQQMDQCKMTENDAVTHIPVGSGNGVVGVMGPDTGEYGNPFFEETVFTNGQGTTVTIPGVSGVNMTGSYLSQSSTGSPNWILSNMEYCLRTLWVSPWQVQLTSAGLAGSSANAADASNLVTVPCDPIDECGSLAINVRFAWWAPTFTPGAGQYPYTTGIPIHLRARVAHYFAKVNPTNGSLVYTTEQEMHDIHTTSARLSTDGGYSEVGLQLSTDARKFHRNISWASIGKYIGTCIMIFCVRGPAPLPLTINGTDIETGAPPALGYTQVANMQVELLATSLKEPGCLGPARIFRMDGLDSGQQIAVVGMGWASCIPTGSMATVGASLAKDKVEGSHFEITRLMRHMYDRSDAFRRIYSSDMYAGAVRAIFQDIQGENFMWDHAQLDKWENLAVTPEAGGFFSDIWGTLKKGVSSIVGAVAPVIRPLAHLGLDAVAGVAGPELGGAIRTIGNAALKADGSFGEAGGSFGRAGASFGAAAAGSFGGAAGSFGGAASGRFAGSRRSRDGYGS
jgi:hypothetical protein